MARPKAIHPSTHPLISACPNSINHQMTDDETANRNRTAVAYRLVIALVVDVKRNKYHDASATALLCFAFASLAAIWSGLVWSGLLVLSVHRAVDEELQPQEKALCPPANRNCAMQEVRHHGFRMMMDMMISCVLLLQRQFPPPTPYEPVTNGASNVMNTSSNMIS